MVEIYSFFKSLNSYKTIPKLLEIKIYKKRANDKIFIENENLLNPFTFLHINLIIKCDVTLLIELKFLRMSVLDPVSAFKLILNSHHHFSYTPYF